MDQDYNIGRDNIGSNVDETQINTGQGYIVANVDEVSDGRMLSGYVGCTQIQYHTSCKVKL